MMSHLAFGLVLLLANADAFAVQAPRAVLSPASARVSADPVLFFGKFAKDAQDAKKQAKVATRQAGSKSNAAKKAAAAKKIASDKAAAKKKADAAKLAAKKAAEKAAAAKKQAQLKAQKQKQQQKFTSQKRKQQGAGGGLFSKLYGSVDLFE